MGRPTQHNHPPRPVRPPGEGQNDTRPLCDTRIPHPPRGGPAIRPGKRGGGHSGRDTPGPFPFPNPEAKTASADGTAPARVWESRTPPPAHHKGGGPPRPPPFLAHTAGHTHATPPTPAIVNPTRTQATRQSSPTGHREPHTHTGHTRHGAPATQPHAPQKPHTRQSSPNRAGSLSIGFGLGLSCGRMVLNVVGLASVC